ncbi:hypothetical protein [Archangium sp.]|jgi:hypothetical protein|uniref:hypothetical protein n=1 Tax=Archangium sp. TaxID=1872627 RepID=UPI002EDB2417
MMNALSTPSRLPLLLLFLLVPGVGLAGQEESATPSPPPSATVEQPPPASSAQPGTQPRAPRRLTEESEYERERSRPSRGMRILAETGAGLLTSAGLGVVGLGVGTGMCVWGIIVQGADATNACLAQISIGTLVGVGLGFPLGVFWGGQAVGGRGNLLGALGGLAGGALVGFFGGWLIGQHEFDGILLSVPLAMVGSIVGYELTTQSEPGPTAARASPVASVRPRLHPVLGFSPRGALVGLRGSF